MVDYDPARFKMILMPRDHLKTSVITIGGTLQKVVQNPETRILLANESGTNAARFLRSIRQHAESNRMFRALYGEIIPTDTKRIRWNDSELDFVREGKFPEPTIDSIGMTGSFTSRHYTHITVDDPISEEAIKSALVMQDVRTRLSGFLSLLNEPEKDSIWLVGTRWGMDDVYQWWIDSFGDRLSILKRSAIENGEPIWPERFSLETLALKRQILGDFRYSALYENDPHNASAQVLDIAKCRGVRWVSDDTVALLDTDGRELARRNLSEMDITATVDLAVSERLTADRTAIVVIGTTEHGEHIVLYTWAIRANPSLVIETLFKVKERFSPRVFGMEAQGYQQAMVHFTKEASLQRAVYLNVEPLKTGKQSKVARVRGMEPLVATGRLYVPHTEHELRREMAEFPLGKHDDLVDALSMHLKLFRKPMGEEFWKRYKATEDRMIERILGKPLDEEDLTDPYEKEHTISWRVA